MSRQTINARAICKTQDAVCDRLMAKLGTTDSRDSVLICHWQYGSNPGFRIQLTRKSDGKTLSRFVDANGNEQA